jgi:hypothetical protein
MNLFSYIFYILLKFKQSYKHIDYKTMGIGDWGLGIGDWGLGPIPNPQSPNPQSPIPILNFKLKKRTLKN